MARLDIESLMPEENAALWSRGGFTYKFFEGKSCVVVFDAAKQKTYIRELENSVTGLSGDTLALPLNDMEYIITDPDAAYIVIPLFSHCLEIRKSGITRRFRFLCTVNFKRNGYIPAGEVFTFMLPGANSANLLFEIVE